MLCEIVSRRFCRPAADQSTLNAKISRSTRRTVVLAGTVAFNRAFGVDLERFEYDGGSYRGRTGAVGVPLRSGWNRRAKPENRVHETPPRRRARTGVVVFDRAAFEGFSAFPV